MVHVWSCNPVWANPIGLRIDGSQERHELGFRRAVVTGAGTGIGLAVVENLLGRSFSVLAVTRDREAAFEQVAGSSLVSVFQADFESDSDLLSLTSALNQQPVDVLINCAGTYDASGSDYEDFGFRMTEAMRVFRVNVVVPDLLIRSVLPYMRSVRQGAIVNVSSIGAKYGSGSGSVFYGASKRAIEALTRTFAREEAKSGIRVNNVRPSIVDTGFVDRSRSSLEARVALIPMGRVSTAAEVAGEIVHLAVDSSFITGQTLAISGGE